jgi:signal transduction histidine kinase/ActR/RegA family two-component response regulator/HAMP domain-containing protein
LKTGWPGIWFKVVLGFFILAFIPLSGMGYFLFQSGKKDVLKAEEEKLFSMVNAERARIEDLIVHALDETAMLSRLPRMSFLAGKVSGARDARGAREEMRAMLKAFINIGGEVEACFFLHPETGEVLKSSDPVHEGKFFDRKPYFEQGRHGTSIYRVHYSLALEKSILAVSAPVTGGGRLLGVLACWANIDSIKKSMGLHAGARTYLVNRSNLYVFDPEPGVGGPFIRTGVFTEAATRALMGETGSGIYADPYGREVVGAYTLIEGLDMALIAEVPLSKVLEDVTGMGRRILLMTVVLAVFILFVSIVAGKKVTGPLIKMSRAAEKISTGRLDHRVDYHSKDELGLLSDSMNRMAEGLSYREKELKDVISTLNALVEHMPEGIAFLNEEDRVVFTNPIGEATLRRLTGAGTGEVIAEIGGRPISDYLVSPPQIMWHEVEVKGPPGAVIEMAARNIGLGEHAGGKVLVLKDVTEERRVEARVQSQERLAAVGQLASGIAHDFNNIITCVIGFSEMLLTDRNLSDEAVQHVSAIQESGKRATELINQILDFSRKSAGELKVVDLKAALGDFLGFIGRILPENIHVAFDAGEDGAYLVNADLTKLQQVLANLAVNSRDAMPYGGRLGFSLSRARDFGDRRLMPDMPGRRWFLLRVTDTGEGINPEVLPHIFEPFYSTKGEGMGTGLGLAQVYGIVRQHKGFIDVRSESGRGSEFLLYLPEAAKEPAPAPPPADKDLPAGKGETVLVVEDDQVVRDLLCKELGRLGYRVLSASGVRETLDLFGRHKAEVQLLLTDIVMPDGDGIELGTRLREEKPGLKVVVVSGYPLESRVPELKEAGIVQWVQKPFNSGSLARAIKDALGRESS